MAFKKFLYDLQLFAEGGGDGGASEGSGGSGTGGTVEPAAQTVEYPKNLPERAKRFYDTAIKKTQKVDTAAPNADSESKDPKTTTEEEETPDTTTPPQKKLTYKELIRSDEYKADHERHIQAVLKDRMKGHNEILGLIAQKYGIDVNSKTFKDDLKAAITADDSVYERYAEEHDVSLDEARRMVGIEEQLKQANEDARARKEEEEYHRTIGALRQAASETKSAYPDFDLDTAMADDRFRRLVVAFGGNTTLAYEAINHKALQQKAVAEAEAKAQAAVQDSVKANRNRPHEGGISSNTGTANDGMPDFRSMNLAELRQYAEQHRKR